MPERTDAVTNEVVEPIRFVLAYPTVERRVNEESNVLRTIKKRKVQLSWPHFRMNCLLKHVVGERKDRIEVTGRRRQLLDGRP
jgi:hypothetical protein